MDVREINVLVLAYLGDTIYEDYIRRYLINKKISTVKELQQEAIKYVSAKAQREYVLKLIDNNILTSDELDVFKRARNNTSSRSPKNCDIVTYKIASGLEAVIGYLDYINNKERIDIIMNYILGE